MSSRLRDAKGRFLSKKQIAALSKRAKAQNTTARKHAKRPSKPAKTHSTQRLRGNLENRDRIPLNKDLVTERGRIYHTKDNVPLRTNWHAENCYFFDPMLDFEADCELIQAQLEDIRAKLATYIFEKARATKKYQPTLHARCGLWIRDPETNVKKKLFTESNQMLSGPQKITIPIVPAHYLADGFLVYGVQLYMYTMALPITKSQLKEYHASHGKPRIQASTHKKAQRKTVRSPRH